MPTIKGSLFQELLGQLQAEHHRQEIMIETLNSENQDLKAKLSDMGQKDSLPPLPGQKDSLPPLPDSKILTSTVLHPGLEMRNGQDNPIKSVSDTPIKSVSLDIIGHPIHSSSEEEVHIGDGKSEPSMDKQEDKSRPSTYSIQFGSESFDTGHVCQSVTFDVKYSSDGTNSRTSRPSMQHRESIPSLQSLFAGDDSDLGKKGKMSGRVSKFRQLTRVNFETTTGDMILQTRGGTWTSVLQPFVQRPNAPKKVIWDLFSVIMVSYDVIVIPLALIDVGESPFMEAMDWVTTTYWTLDLPFGFLTGFHRQGTIEMRPNAVIMNYLKSWFVFDFSVVCVDWFIIVSTIVTKSSSADDGDTTGFLRFGKAGGRVNRIFRAIRLMRFLKLQRLLVEILQLVKSEYVHTLCNVGLSVLFIAVVAHYIACGWLWTGKMNADAGIENWVYMSELGDNTTLYKYATSLHWSLTQFTPASMEVRPYNISERFYSIVVLFFALITFSSFLGSITTAMSQLRRLHNDQTNQQILLRKFFTDNKLSAELGQRIWKFIRNTHFVNKTRMPVEDLPLLMCLPHTLRRDLYEELYRPYLTRLPFFFHYAALGTDAGQTGLADLCAEAIAEGTSIAGDELFCDAQQATQIFIAMSGKMTYTELKGEGGEFLDRDVKAGTWVGEPALWLEWVHLGALTASTSCEVLKLKLDAFRQVMRNQPSNLPFAKEYAKAFLRYLRRLENVGSNTNANTNSWKTDLITDRDELHEIALEAFGRIGYDDKRLDVIRAQKMARMNSISAGTLGFFQRLRLRFRRRRSAADSDVIYGSGFGSGYASR